jgi:hypothetical protein
VSTTFAQEVEKKSASKTVEFANHNRGDKTFITPKL